MRRTRNAKIVATLGPSSSDKDTLRRLFLAGVDAFRLNFSHGSAAEHCSRFALLRELERETGRPIAILADLQGPKLRVGTFPAGQVMLVAGQAFRLDLDESPGDAARAGVPHPEFFAALAPGMDLLLDDGRLHLVVESCGAEFAQARVVVGGALSDRKGLSVPGVRLPLQSLTAKDRHDLALALELGADWIALSFVQGPEDVEEVRALIGRAAAIISKLETPAAIEHLEEIVALSDAVMVARGDLGVELPAEQVPAIQKRIVRCCRRHGKPVIVATQMLESMVDSPVPTRAEASDVATAVYEGADAVMLSAETAVGKYPVATVDMMNRIVQQVEADPAYRQLINASHNHVDMVHMDIAHATCSAMRLTVTLIHAAVVVSYTISGFTTLGAARERAEAPILSLTPNLGIARRMALVWGVHSAQIGNIVDMSEMTDAARSMALREHFAEAGQTIVVIAGVPFVASGNANFLCVATA